ncbi:MAG: relaxase/mobilization nuclease domain-containing protein [Epsilonproteobacteria bacterium]|nr:relaxase/mobilization nuclease domain-containing protein [Campylobacterota bacterium]
MIVKQIAKKQAGKGSFGGLADYILDKANGGEKVDWVEANNLPFEDIDANIAFVQEVQKMNETAKGDKVLHFVFSFQEGEIPSREVQHDIESEFIRTLGLEDHHRISVAHNNTNNYHVHVAVNMIHPETHTLADPFRSKLKLQKKAAELEVKHALQTNNHVPNYILEKQGIKKAAATSPIPEKIKSQEIHSGVDSLLTWIKEEALDDIKEVLKDPKSSLEDLHQVLADYNLELKPRGNGIVIADKTRKLFVKASDVHRDLSKGKLEKCFGEFKTSNITTTPKKKFGRPVNEYWKRYQELSTQKRSTKKEELRLEKLARTTLRVQLKEKYE